MEARTSVIKLATVVKKMPSALRPNNNELYSFFGGNRSHLSVAQIDKMKTIIEKGSAEIIKYLEEATEETTKKK